MLESGLPYAFIGGIICIMTFFIGRMTAAKNDGERWGKLEAILERNGKDIERLGEKLDKFTEESNRANSELAKRFDESVRRLHARMDEHIATFHNPPKEGA